LLISYIVPNLNFGSGLRTQTIQVTPGSDVFNLTH
jgi:hypothetical protein